jgi:hypothetical protein
MPEETPQTNSHTENPLVHYERTDASYPWVRAFVIAATVIAAVIFGGVIWFLEAWKMHEDQVKQSPYPLAPMYSTKLPAKPQLEQLDRMGDVEQANVYKREQARLDVLDSHGPTAEKGFIHIPIDQAIDLLAGDKKDKKLHDTWLPARQEPPAEQRKRSEGLLDAGASNSGRMFRGEAK